MNPIRIVAVGLLALALTVIGVYWTNVVREPRLQAKIGITGKGDLPRETFVKACPNEAIGGTDSADYKLTMFWSDQDKSWHGFLLRKDDAVLKTYQGPDSAKIARQICQFVQRDFPAWLATERERTSSESREQTGRIPDQVPSAGRFELRDVRNGPLFTTAMIDTKSGRVWVWIQYHDKNGKETSSGFLEEDITPKPSTE
jgi:hypothetical protein